MAKTISAFLFVGAIGFIVYLAATGVTLDDCGRWIERNLGVQLRTPEAKDVPYTNYAPVVPGR